MTSSQAGRTRASRGNTELCRAKESENEAELSRATRETKQALAGLSRANQDEPKRARTSEELGLRAK